MSIEGQGHFFTIYFPGLFVLCFTRPRYQVSVYRTTGPLVCFAALRKEKREKLVSSKRIRYDETEAEDNEITTEQVFL